MTPTNGASARLALGGLIGLGGHGLLFGLGDHRLGLGLGLGDDRLGLGLGLGDDRLRFGLGRHGLLVGLGRDLLGLGLAAWTGSSCSVASGAASSTIGSAATVSDEYIVTL